MDTTQLSRGHVWTYKIALFLLGLCTLFLIYAIVLLVWPYQTIKLNGPIIVTNAPIPAGSTAIYTVDQCRYTDAVIHTIRRLVSDDQSTPSLNTDTANRTVYIPLGSSDSRAPRGCNIFTPPPVQIPMSTPPGTYHIEFELHFEVNPIREIVKTVESKPFSVTAPVRPAAATQ